MRLVLCVKYPDGRNTHLHIPHIREHFLWRYRHKAQLAEPLHTAQPLRIYSCSARWTNEIAIEPSPTADATRLTLPARTSPTAKTPGRLVSRR